MSDRTRRGRGDAQGCPFGAFAACGDCDGSCWEPQVLHTWGPEPCEGCYYVTAKMMVCDHTCDGLTAENVEQRRADYERRQGNG